MDETGLPDLLARALPLYREGYGWLCAAAVLLVLSLAAGIIHRKK